MAHMGAFGPVVDAPIMPDDSGSGSDSDSDSGDSVTSNSVRNSGVILRNGASTGLGGRVGSKAGRTLKPPEVEMRSTATPEDLHIIADQLRKAEKTGETNLGKLDFVVVPRAHLTALMNGTCAALRVLELSENGIEEFPWDFFANLQRLEVVKLTQNRLQYLPSTLLHLPLLQVLLLDNNRLQMLNPAPDDPMFTQGVTLPSLCELGVEWNQLRDFPTDFVAGCPQLQKLFISENPNLLAIPQPMFFASRAHPMYVKLDNRPPLQMQAQAFIGFPMVMIDWNKIYPDKVLEYVYLGSIRTAQSPEVYKDLDIGHVLTLGRNLDVVLTADVDQLEINIDDVPGEDITPFFDACFDYINRAIAERKGVLLHCFAGLSRSVTIMVAYLMAFQYPMSADDALALVREARPASNPNDGFIDKLRAFEERLRHHGGYRPSERRLSARHE